MKNVKENNAEKIYLISSLSFAQVWENLDALYERTKGYLDVFLFEGIPFK